MNSLCATLLTVILILIFEHRFSIIQMSWNCHAYGIDRIAAANEYKKFNPCHNCKKVDSKGRSLFRIGTKLMHVRRFRPHSTWGFHHSPLWILPDVKFIFNHVRLFDICQTLFKIVSEFRCACCPNLFVTHWHESSNLWFAISICWSSVMYGNSAMTS